ncbi:AraC family transcriptional regulator [Kitasatospora phosalacinea]|uniref:AraC family transcriptional regulator n=1 Tax=Kitasatospora phosalacinea TaxID=2065 RepID=A0ABW6GMD6_9ACTN
METLRFDSRSVDATEEFLSTAYTPMRIGGPVEDARVRISRRAVEGLSVDRLSFGYDMAFDAHGLPGVCLISMHSGTLVDRTGGHEQVYGPGDTFLLAPPGTPYRGEVRSARYTIAMFDPALLAGFDPSGADAPVRLTGTRPLTRPAGRALGSAVAHLRDHVLGSPATPPDGLLVSTAAQHLAALTLAALPHTARTDPTPTDHRDATPATLRRALTWIDAHADQDVTLADIARAAYVTPRALQYAFRRHLGTTPLAHLRHVRLQAAHRELLAADPRTTTVTKIALHWGFAHQGHFAAHYRTTFGTTPSTTLHRNA